MNSFLFVTDSKRNDQQIIQLLNVSVYVSIKKVYYSAITF